jgi:hypothetical protein
MVSPDKHDRLIDGLEFLTCKEILHAVDLPVDHFSTSVRRNKPCLMDACTRLPLTYVNKLRHAIQKRISEISARKKRWAERRNENRRERNRMKNKKLGEDHSSEEDKFMEIPSEEQVRLIDWKLNIYLLESYGFFLICPTR